MGTTEVREEYRAFAERVRRGRTLAGRTQAQIGKAIGRSREWVQGVESARILPTDADTTDRLARAIQVDPADLWEVVVELRTPEDRRTVWLRRIAAASLRPGELSEAERTLILTLRSLGGRMGKPDALVGMVGDLLKGWEWADSAVMRSFASSGEVHRPATEKVDALIGVLSMVRRMNPAAQRGFVSAMLPLAQAFGIAQVHGSAEFRAAVDGIEPPR